MDINMCLCLQWHLICCVTKTSVRPVSLQVFLRVCWHPVSSFLNRHTIRPFPLLLLAVGFVPVTDHPGLLSRVCTRLTVTMVR